MALIRREYEHTYNIERSGHEPDEAYDVEKSVRL